MDGAVLLSPWTEPQAEWRIWSTTPVHTPNRPSLQIPLLFSRKKPLRDKKLGDLDRVCRSSFAEIVSHAPQIQAILH